MQANQTAAIEAEILADGQNLAEQAEAETIAYPVESTDTAEPTEAYGNTEFAADTETLEPVGNPHALAALVALSHGHIVGPKPQAKRADKPAKPAAQPPAQGKAKPAQAPAGKRAEKAARGERATAPTVAPSDKGYPGDPGDIGVRLSPVEIAACIGDTRDYAGYRLVVRGRREVGGAIARTARYFAVIGSDPAECFANMWALGYAGLFETMAREAGFVEVTARLAMLPDGYKLDGNISVGFARARDASGEVLEFVAHGSRGGPRGGPALTAEQAKARGLLVSKAKA